MRGLDRIAAAAPWLSACAPADLPKALVGLAVGAASPLRGARAAFCAHLLTDDATAWRTWRETIATLQTEVEPRLWRAAATVEVGAQGGAAPNDLSGRTFPHDLIVAHDGVASDIWLNGSTVAGALRLDRARIEGGLDAQGLVVRGRVSAAGLRVAGALDLSSAVLNDVSDFSEVEIDGVGGFASVRFADATSFHGATFGDDARFLRAAFDGPVSFAAARFRGGAIFERARFGADADFHGARFDGQARFDGAEGSSPTGLATLSDGASRPRRPKAG